MQRAVLIVLVAGTSCYLLYLWYKRERAATNGASGGTPTKSAGGGSGGLDTGAAAGTSSQAAVAVLGSLGDSPWGMVKALEPYASSAPKWIWAGGEHSEPSRRAVLPGPYWLRRSVTVPNAQRGTFIGTCDNQFTAKLNGTTVASSANWTSTQTVPVNLVSGANQLEVQVRNFEPGLAAGGFLCVLLDAGNRVLAVSDATWSWTTT